MPVMLSTPPTETASSAPPRKRWTPDECMVLEWQLVPRAAFVAASVLVLLFSGNLGHEAFIYFQF